MKNARFPKFGSCALARKMNFVISIFDQQDYGLWGCGKLTLAIQRRQSRYRARLSSSRQYSSSNIQMFLNENVSACIVCCVFLFTFFFLRLLAERVFSQLKLIRTDHRNRLDSASCSSLLKVNFGLNSLDALRPLQTLATSYLNMPKKLKLMPLLPKNSDFS